MSYGDEPTTLPFEGLHVACLSGDNGNGKSALLDAITWALWDKTRASSVQGVSADDIIRLGAEEVEVRFEFELNGQRYRVVRKRRRGKSSPSDWQLTQQNSKDEFVAVGGGSQRETGKQIIKLLNMEYETFLNSAYLQQGRADEFTRQKPAERKRILGEILDLERFDRLEAMAREKYKERVESLKELEGELNILQGRQKDRPGLEAQLAEVCATIAGKEIVLTEQEKKAHLWRDRRSKMDAIAQQAVDAEATCRRIQVEVKNREQELAAKQTRLRQMQEILQQREAILGDYQRLQEARKRREKLDPEIEEFVKKNSELHNARSAIEMEKVRLENDLKLKERALQEVERRKQNRERLEAQRLALESELQGEAEIAAQREAARAELQAAQEAYADLKGRHNRLKEMVEEVDEVLAILARPHASCPVCDSDLSGAKHETVVRKQEQKRIGYVQEQSRLKKEGGEAKQRQAKAQELLQQWDAQATALAQKRAQYHQIVEQCDRLSAEGVETAALQEEVLARRKQLETEDFAAPKRAHCQRLEKELEILGLKKTEYETVLQTIKRLEDTEKRYLHLQQTETSFEEEQRERDRLEKALAEQQNHLFAAQEKLRGFQAQLGQYESIRQEALLAENELKRLSDEVNSLRIQEGRLRKSIEDCERAAREHKARSETYKKLDEERRIYLVLTQAFGKKGIQSLIIENALPELQDETNSLLARMTDNALQVSFETMRSARSGSHDIETLDIKVMDDAGARPYEMFSGGEGFRVNFAIRIALSRLLARRSGAKLQTLILDEGFGSQDGKGREKLVEVIEAIKDDFEKILVITHFEEMKDSFPQRIEVIKDAGGSRIHLL
jgi:exonuclease SbcC